MHLFIDLLFQVALINKSSLRRFFSVKLFQPFGILLRFFFNGAQVAYEGSLELVLLQLFLIECVQVVPLCRQELPKLTLHSLRRLHLAHVFSLLAILVIIVFRILSIILLARLITVPQQHVVTVDQLVLQVDRMSTKVDSRVHVQASLATR